MRKLKLKNNIGMHSIILDIDFIDQHMIKANGEYVKVYLLLLRHLSIPGEALSISKIADTLDITEKDVARALRYWKKQGLVDYETKESTPSPEVPDVVSAPNITPYRNKPKKSERNKGELKQILFIAEKYLGKTLTYTEADTIAFIVEELLLPMDLIDYLIDYCVETGHKDFGYIKKVAIRWSEQGFTTVEEAKASTISYNKNCYSILRAFGITGRAPASAELVYIKRWMKEFAFPLDIVLTACDRTIEAIHQPSFEYADKILRNWHLKGVNSEEDITNLDASFRKLQNEQRKRPQNVKTKKTSFSNFEERSYNMNDLEKKLIQ